MPFARGATAPARSPTSCSATCDRSARVAFDVLRRIERDGAYANLALGPALDASELLDADRRFATDLVYGTTRMRRACDALVDRFVTPPPDASTRTLLRLGAYQLAFAGVRRTPRSARRSGSRPNGRAGSSTPCCARSPGRRSSDAWPSDGARLSYPDWIVDR